MNWEHFKALIWLRWRLWGNRWRRSSDISRVLSVAMTGLTAAGLLGALVGGIAAGWMGLRQADSLVHLITWDIGIGIFLFFWLIGLLTELQRSETLDTAKLMHLPVSLPQLLLLNFASSLVVPSIILLGTGTLGITLGLLLSGPRWVLLGLPVAALVFAVAAWTYQLRGWLSVLMANARRKRAILISIALGSMLLGQLPNLLFNNPWTRHRLERKMAAEFGQMNAEESRAARQARIRAVHRYIPPAWPAYAISGLARGEIAPALATTVGLGLVGVAGLWSAFRQARRLYGQADGRSKRSIAKARVKSDAAARALELPSKPAFNDRVIPWIPAEAGTLALTFLRSHLRATELRIMFASTFFLIVVLFAVYFRRLPSFSTGNGMMAFMLPAAVVMSLIGISQIFLNQFGYDRHGFRSLVLLPTPRRLILLGKNLALFPLAAAIGVLFSLGAAFVTGLGIMGAVAGLSLWLSGFVILSIYGNWLSILIPYRVNPGMLRKGNASLGQTLKHLVAMLGQVTALSPLALTTGVYFIVGRTPLAMVLWIITTLILLTGVVALYWVTLPTMGEFLESREQAILNEVTREVE
ncbi:MAG TPA: hypothetical protein VMF06_24685 [Candidatus Limnocylindria bacterium]|nr:hypothetical protein [Candidatus Limnocylindria bacterium]